LFPNNLFETKYRRICFQTTCGKANAKLKKQNNNIFSLFFLAENKKGHTFAPFFIPNIYLLILKTSLIMKISLVRLSTKNLATLAQRVINSSKSNAYRVVENHPLLNVLDTEYNKYRILYNKLSYSGKGDAVMEADKNRDTPFISIRNFLTGITFINTMPNYQAAVEVLEVIKKYGTNLERMSYSEETAQMTMLIEELDSEEMQAKLTALNLLPTYSKLKQAQTDFEALYAEQAEANADLRSLPSATSARKGLEKALRDYFNLLNIMSSQPEWSGLHAEMNELAKAAANS
jgi:hypothetical protein